MQKLGVKNFHHYQLVIMSICLFISLFHTVHTLPAPVKFSETLLCLSPSTYLVPNYCWLLNDQEQFQAYRQNLDMLRLDFPESFEPVSALARFNFHIYLDHMWHLNIGF